MAPDRDADHLIHRAIVERVEELSLIEPAVRADDDDAVHQMRVTIRRIRSLLRAEAGAPEATADIDADLRWLAGVLGAARDAEVLAQRYRHALQELDPQLVRGRVVERLVDDAESGYRSGWSASVTALDSPRYRQLLTRLDALAAAPTHRGKHRQESEPDTVRGAYRRVRKAAKKSVSVDGAGHDEALHRIRKAAKRLRYTAAAMGAPSVAEQAKALQTLLGDHQDSVVSRAHLRAQSRAAYDAGEDTFTFGLLYQREVEIARHCRAHLDAALAELSDAVSALAGGRAGL